MPIDIREFLKLADQDKYTQNGSNRQHRNGAAGGNEDSADAGKWRSLFSNHPESGGAFGGRNNAVVALTGFLRAKSFPYEAGRFFALRWNSEYCNPPLDESEVLDVVSRAWWRWQEGGMRDEAPEDFAEGAQKKKDPERSSILTVAELLAIAEDPDKQLKWVAPNLIQEDGVTIISAPSGNGKTWLALDFCRHLTRAEDEEYGDWLGQYPLPRMRCLYMDEENGERTLGLRVGKLGFPVENENFLSWSDSRLKLDVAKDRAEIIKTAKDREIRVIVFDSLKAFNQRDENSATEMRKVGEWLREFVIAGFCVIVLHHDKKGNGLEGGSEQDKTRGSGDIVAFSQTVLGLQQKGSLYHLSQRKVRNAEKSEDVIIYQIAPDRVREGGVFLDVEGAKEKAEAAREHKREESAALKAERVREAIDHLEKTGQPVTNKNIATVARMSIRDVSEARRASSEVSDRWDMRDE